MASSSHDACTGSSFPFEAIVYAATLTYTLLKHLSAPGRGNCRINDAIARQFARDDQRCSAITAGGVTTEA